jgi:hypothetical protein
MSYSRPRRVSKLSGILIFGALIVFLAIGILSALLVLGSVFSGFDTLTNMLPGAPQNWLGLYNTLKTTLSGVFPLLAVMMLIAAIGVLVIAIFSLSSPGGSED